MSGPIVYNIGGIEGEVAGINAQHAQGMDAAHGIMTQYQKLDEVASGQATNAGLEFAQSADDMRNKAGELVQALNQAVTTSSSDQQDVDSYHRGVMGS